MYATSWWFRYCCNVRFYLGCAALRLPVLLDGLISLTAAVAAQTLHQDVASYLFASHIRQNPVELALRALDLQPVYDMNLAVGEGTGGVAMLSAIDLAFAAFRDLPTFEEGSVESISPCREIKRLKRSFWFPSH